MINRRITIARKNNFVIKQSDDEKFFLIYNNSEIIFSSNAFQHLINQLNVIREKKEQVSNFTLKIITNSFSVKISTEDIDDFIQLLSEVASGNSHTCRKCNRKYLLTNLFKNRLN